ncbi:MAG: hypothetical protein H6Q82_2352 [Deltaproteobacteria bacterium]|nr:hypothetical protein [Deltaproteobacteria bacterium]
MPSNPVDLLEKLLRIGCLAPDDPKAIRDRSSAPGIPVPVDLSDLLHFTPGVQMIVVPEGTPGERLSRVTEEDFCSAVQPVQEMPRRGMVTYEDVAPYFR